MKEIFKSVFLAGLFIFAIASPVMATITPQPVSAAGANCEARLLGIPPWYRGLTNDDCTIKSPSDLDPNGLSKFVWQIVLNGIEMALVITAYIAVFFIMYGGFLYLTGGSNPSQLEKARKSITNAIIGLVIAMSAIAINNLIFSIIT